MPDNSFIKPFAAFAPAIHAPTALRRAITAAYRRPEEECLPPLIEAARFDTADKKAIAATARRLAEALRQAQARPSMVEGLVQEYALSSEEGIALMCLAEALLRIPDNATRDALIRDKIADGNWKAHLHSGRSMFVNAATWGLIVTGRLTGKADSGRLGARLSALLGRYGEPLIRKAVAMAINLMGERFVRGETIEKALQAANAMEEKGFRYSYDMLGEAAMTAADAGRYFDSYKQAIDAIGAAAAGATVYERPGISIKLSALHPRYSRAQADRVMGELLPRVRELALMARRYNIGFNIDAEEADRLEISLDIMEALLFDKELQGWEGIGFVVQAYGRRCPYVLDYLIDAARRSRHRIMLRLVKGAYWDSEIKRGQVEGLSSYPVYTRKVFTDIAYIACARKLLGALDAVFPQFATHNAQTLATIYHMAGADYRPDKYEFQCLHGMGEALYSQVVGADKLARPARIYAPVGSYETLLAYLVRRLLENGANSSFVHRIADENVTLEELIADPADSAALLPDLRQNDKIARPEDLFLPQRRNSAGLDLSDETVLAGLSAAFQQTLDKDYRAVPTVLRGRKVKPGAITALDEQLIQENAAARPVLNPADQRDIVGYVLEADAGAVQKSFAEIRKGALFWHEEPAEKRAAILAKAADLMQERMAELLALCCREAGKSITNAVAELREAVDFLRYYGAEMRESWTAEQKPLGVIVCISPWNFPLAIFTGQIAAALAAGNGVLAKPAEETPLIAALAVEILHEAGVPHDVLALVPGDGAVGAALVAHEGAGAVVFTGSTAAARSIQASLAGRFRAGGQKPGARPVPLIAETGGQNAMIVDSSALAEQVAADCVASAFDSAGQRCSALRLLCLQEDIADNFITMLKGAMAELRVGRTDFLHNDIGPVISHEAAALINRHIAAMRAKGFPVTRLQPAKAEIRHGSFVPPAIIEIDTAASLKQEVFGPVLHIIRYKRAELDALIAAINASGYGLTFGLHTRLNDTIRHVCARIDAGNIYINRNIIGAIVGSQPFGGRGLSGTGPKAGGPLYTGRMALDPPRPNVPAVTAAAGQGEGGQGMRIGADRRLAALRRAALGHLAELAAFAAGQGFAAIAAFARQAGQESLLGLDIELPGPVGEENRYKLQPRGTVFIKANSAETLLFMLALCLATGNKAVCIGDKKLQERIADLPAGLRRQIRRVNALADIVPAAYALLEAEGEELIKLQKALAALPGAIIPLQAASAAEMRAEAAFAAGQGSAAAEAGPDAAEQGSTAAGQDEESAGQNEEAARPGVFAMPLLLEEVAVSNNIVAVGGNAKLMNVG